MGAMLAPSLHLGGFGINMSQVVMVCPSSVPGDQNPTVLKRLTCRSQRASKSLDRIGLLLL
jgi:hypothetical protein